MIDSHGGYTLVVFFPISDLLKQYQQSEGNNLGAPDGEANLHNPEFYLNLFPPDWRDVHLLASAAQSKTSTFTPAGSPTTQCAMLKARTKSRYAQAHNRIYQVHSKNQLANHDGLSRR